MSTEEQQEDFYLELGDIIKINAPDNSDLDDKTFYIDYLDENRATIIDPDTLGEFVLDILNGQFTDESIKSIEILSRPEEVGYARQNGLTTGAWISIQFGGEVPLTSFFSSFRFLCFYWRVVNCLGGLKDANAQLDPVELAHEII